MSGGDIFWVTDGDRETVNGDRGQKVGLRAKVAQYFLGFKVKILIYEYIIQYGALCQLGLCVRYRRQRIVIQYGPPLCPL
jgi:hypothetical protein